MPMSDQAEWFAAFADLLRLALGERVDPAAETFLDMVAEEVVMEFPYAPPGVVRRLTGRAALARHLDHLVGVIVIDRFSAPLVHETRDPGIVVVEFGCTGHGVVTGEPYDQRYISVVTVRGGRIVHYRDYWNPLVVLRAIGGGEAPAAALGTGDRSDG